MKPPLMGHIKETGKNCYIDLDILVRSRLVVQASSGGGKTHALRRLLEGTRPAGMST